jgi:hypothetical protein
MSRNGWIASVLFSTLCTACILTLFSQAERVSAKEGLAPATTLHLDPEASASPIGDLVPAALHRSAVLHVGSTGGEDTEPAGETRATLRLK